MIRKTQQEKVQNMGTKSPYILSLYQNGNYLDSLQCSLVFSRGRKKTMVKTGKNRPGKKRFWTGFFHL